MILSDFPVFVGVKWLKYSCNVVTNTTYEQWPPPDPDGLLYQTRKSNETEYSHTGYTFSREHGFQGTGQISCKGNAMSGYMVGTTSVHQYANAKDRGDGYTEYRMPIVAYATSNTTTTYSKGGTSYGSVYADKNDLPADGQLIEGSASDAYCVIRTGGTYYYYEKSI